LAVQLRALGHKVEAVFVIDMFAPGYPRKLPRWRRAWMHLCNLVRLPFKEKKAYLRERFGKLRHRVLHWMGQGIRNAPTIDVEGLEEDVLKRVWLTLTTAQRRYRPQKPFDGKVVLVKAEEGFKWPATILDDPLFGWGQWAHGGVEMHTIPGGHMEMFHDKNINRVARLVMDSIELLPSVRACSVSEESLR
jgi:thioesterase domain-containing protein